MFIRGTEKCSNSLLQDQNFFKELQKYFNELKTQDRENVIVE